MKISFLVTYYNQKDYVCQSLDSILAIEKPCDWEILVGDDGSNDGTTDIVKEYMDRYPDKIFLYVMDREQGKKYEIVRRSSANRLNLIDHMTGDYFCFLDGDDRYCSTDFVVQALQVYNAQPEVSVVAFGYQTFSDAAGVLASYPMLAGPVDTDTYLRTGMYTPGGACVMKNFMSAQHKAFLHRVGYYDDNNIIAANLHFGTMYALETVIYAYRQSENSTINAMDLAEVAVLNAQSYDVDIKLLPRHADALLERYGNALLQTCFLRSRLPQLLGQDKFDRYLSGCSQLEDALSYLLLNTAGKTRSGEKRIASTILRLIKLHPRRAFREFKACMRCRSCNTTGA